MPWVRRLPTPGELKALRVEAEWNPVAAATLRTAIERLKELVAAAKADEHDVVNPTHAAYVRGKPVGYASIETVAMMTLWMHSASRPRESVQLLNQAENAAAQMGYGVVVVPCAADSPFYPMLDGRLGYAKPGAERALFVKNLR
jgi:hypothetical protein